ncbi:MAG: PAS domain S-box protein [Geobacteraceae bacterium]|nr:PAS domain S-box protein [Geobacteraceae bacterium]
MNFNSLKSRITLLVSLPLVATAGAVFVVSLLKNQNNHFYMLLTFLVSGTLFTFITARITGRAIDDRQKEQAQQLGFLQTLIDTIPNPVYYKDASGVYLGCNRAFEAATGAVRTDIIGRRAHEFFAQALADIYCRGDEEIFSRGGEQLFGSVAPYADGTLRNVIFHKATFNNIDGSLGGLVGIYMDITEQKEVQDALSMEKNFIDSLIQGSSSPTFVIDKNHNLLYWNRACEALTGVPADDLIGTDRHWSAFYRESARCLADMLIDRVPPSGTKAFHSSNIIRDGLQGEGWLELSGKRRYLVFSAAPIFGDRGEIVAAVETLEDMTEQKLLEEKLVNLTYAVTQCPIGIIITDSSGVIEYVNPRFTEITGYEHDDLLGEHSVMFKWVEASDKVYREMITTILDGKEWRGRFHKRKKNGDLYWEDTLIAPIKSSDGEVTNFIAMNEDISDKVRLEEELHYSQKMDSIGRMAGGMAHDFNNILTAISGYVGIMEFYTPEESPLTSSLTQVRNSVERAAALVQSLLDFSRRQRTNPLPVNLNDIVKRVGSLLSSLLGEDITVHKFLSEAPLEITADTVQIEQMIMHLVNNSRDAMPHGGDLWIGTRRATLDNDFVRRYGYGTIGDYALLTMTDNGSGMDAATLEKIYEPFFSTKGVGKGSGLGLSVVYGCVKLHKGFLTCYSEPEKGTQFNIYFPLKKEAGESDDDQPKQLPRISDSSQLRGDETILLVEDDKEVLAIIKSLLQEFGYTVLTARNGKQAVSIFSENTEKIKMVMLDAIMPKKSGWDTYLEIRAQLPWVKALFISGYTREALIEKGMLDEGSIFLPKPIAPVDLLRTVREVLAK